VLLEKNRPILKSIGQVIYLTSDLTTLFARVAKDKSRPLLQVSDPQKAYGDIFRERDPIYRDLADIVFESDDTIAPLEVAKRIHQLIVNG